MVDALVTGGAGFIGAPLVTALRESGRFRHVISLDIIPGDRTDVVADVTRPFTVPGDYQFTHCFHLAGIAKEPGFPDETYHEVNDLGTEHVLTWCQDNDVRTVIFTSTMMVFGAGETRYDESGTPCPDTAYGASKAAAEKRLLAWAAPDDRNVRIVRPGVVFGPGDVGNFTRLRAMLRRRMFFYVGRRSTVKSCVHLDDLVGFLTHLVGVADGQIFHCVLPDEVTIEQIVEGIFAAFGGRYRVPTVPFRLAHVASRPFELLAKVGVETGIHRRRIEKLYRSTNISAGSMTDSGYKLVHPTVKDALAAWARYEFDYRDPQAGRLTSDGRG